MREVADLALIGTLRLPVDFRRDNGTERLYQNRVSELLAICFVNEYQKADNSPASNSVKFHVLSLTSFPTVQL